MSNLDNHKRLDTLLGVFERRLAARLRVEADLSVKELTAALSALVRLAQFRRIMAVVNTAAAAGTGTDNDSTWNPDERANFLRAAALFRCQQYKDLKGYFPIDRKWQDPDYRPGTFAVDDTFTDEQDAEIEELARQINAGALDGWDDEEDDDE